MGGKKRRKGDKCDRVTVLEASVGGENGNGKTWCSRGNKFWWHRAWRTGDLFQLQCMVQIPLSLLMWNTRFRLSCNMESFQKGPPGSDLCLRVPWISVWDSIMSQVFQGLPFVIGPTQLWRHKTLTSERENSKCVGSFENTSAVFWFWVCSGFSFQSPQFGGSQDYTNYAWNHSHEYF